MTSVNCRAFVRSAAVIVKAFLPRLYRDPFLGVRLGPQALSSPGCRTCPVPSPPRLRLVPGLQRKVRVELQRGR
jgi:hypothetical protein